jgi:cytidylate kinase
MNKIITIGREFGSGGRELGKRLSEHLGCAYYDKEIINEIARRTQLAESYVQSIVEHKEGIFFPITIGRSFHPSVGANSSDLVTAVYSEQATVLREMAERSNCIIVGRCADYILREMKPMRIFVYADMEAKIARCRLKAEENEGLNDRQLEKKIRSIDKSRARYYRYYTGQNWGDHSNYDICINTSSISVKECAEMLAHILAPQ